MENLHLQFYNSNSLLAVNQIGQIRILYTPFRAMCITTTESIPANTWVYVDEVCNTAQDELVYVIYGKFYSYKLFQLAIKF